MQGPRGFLCLLGVLIGPGSNALAETYHPDPALRFSATLQVVETNERDAFNAAPDGGTAATTGESNLALAANGAVAFESSRIADTYGEDKANNGTYGVELPDVDDATRPWIAADFDASGFVGVLLAESFAIGKIGFGSRFTSRSDGVFTLQATTDDFVALNLDDAVAVAALDWVTLGTVTSFTPGEFGRHLVTFEPVANVTAVRIVVSQGGTSITEIEVYSESDYEPPPPPPPPDPPAAPTAYSSAILADAPLHYYRFEETHPEQPAKDAIGAAPDGNQPGAFLGAMMAGAASAFARLGKAAQFDGTPGTLVDLGVPFHLGPTLSIEAWVWLDPTAASAYAPIAARWDGSYELDVNQGAARANFVTRNAINDFALAESTGAFTKGVWHHLVGVFDAGKTTLYLDGRAGTTVDTSPGSSDLQDAGATLFIGATRDGSAFLWKGLIDEVAFYDYALTPEQINAHIAAAEDDCAEERDSVRVIGPSFGDPNTDVELQAVFEGADPGSTVTYLWERVQGLSILTDATTARVKVRSSREAEVIVKVTANDGVCPRSVAVEHRITFKASDAQPGPTAYTEAVLADGPIHYYRFEETHTMQAAKDAIGPAPSGDHPGAFRGTVAAGEPGAFPTLGLAAKFDGTPQCLVDLLAPFSTGASVSVEAWAFLDEDAAADFAPIAARWDGSYELDVNKGTGRANFVSRNDVNEFALAESTDLFSRGEWHHVVGIFDGGTTTIYLDGVQGSIADTSATGGSLPDAGPTLFIGSTRDGGTFLWKGLIDEVAFYDYPLDVDQIAAHIEAAGGTCQEDPDSVAIGGMTQGLVGHPVALEATFQGIDAGASASYKWSLVSGLAGSFQPNGASLSFVCSDPGQVVVRVEVGDGKCRDVASAEATVTCIESAVFHRGDADGNGELQLTDAVHGLGCLFLGFECSRCLDAADADDNGQLQLTDSVRILIYLFLGGAPPAAPGPTTEPCGVDPTTEDLLDCKLYNACQ